MDKEESRRNKGPFHLKRTSTDQSDAILLTFSHKWCDLIRSDRVRAVFRKQGPLGFTPQLMYVYASAPTSAVIARMPIVSYEILPTAEAFTFADLGAIDVAELRQYGRTMDTLIVMKTGSVFVAESAITFAFMAKHFNFWPSSTFIPLSATGVKKLDDLGQFRPI